jgi:hypothetical protein
LFKKLGRLLSGNILDSFLAADFPRPQVFLLYTAPQKLNMGKSLRERTAQNALSFKLIDRFERCANSFFFNSLIALHSFSFTKKIKDHSSLLSVRSIYKSDVPSSDLSALAFSLAFWVTLPCVVHLLNLRTNKWRKFNENCVIDISNRMYAKVVVVGENSLVIIIIIN